MKIDNVKLPKSSFLSTEKDMAIIVDNLLKNERLKRLLFYPTEDALSKQNLSPEESLGLVGKNIRMVPKLSVDGTVLSYIIVNFDNFMNGQNPEFRDNIIEFDIICHFDQWQMKDFQLRPYKIAAEIDSMFDNSKLTGIGELHFLGANQMVLNDEFAGLCLMYQAVHGGEDKKEMPNPADEERFAEDFEKYING